MTDPIKRDNSRPEYLVIEDFYVINSTILTFILIPSHAVKNKPRHSESSVHCVLRAAKSVHTPLTRNDIPGTNLYI
jgi:hypothetical protein